MSIFFMRILYYIGKGSEPFPLFPNIFSALASKPSKLEYQATRVSVTLKVIMIHMVGRPH